MRGLSRDHAPSTCAATPKSAAPEPGADLWCDLCGRPASPHDFNEVAAMVICPQCLEDSL